ncbi:hypothetical protein NFI96_013224, partial [Prochilodus magdalenae]
SQGPWAGQESQGPWAGQESRGPQAGQESREPRAGQESLGPQAGQESQGPWAGQESLGPQAGQESREPQAGQESLGPQAGQESQGPWAGQESQGPWAGQESQGPRAGQESRVQAAMKVLTRAELKLAEETLRRYLPRSQQVCTGDGDTSKVEAYGFVMLINRVDADPIDVLVDHWPDFSVLLVKPIQQEETDLYKGVCIFTKDDVSLKNTLLGTDVLDWTQYLCLSIDLCHEEALNAVAAKKGVATTRMSMCHMMTLRDPADLPTDRLPVRISSLQESHVTLVNSTWKFGSGEFSERMIRNMIQNYPSCCVLDSDAQPVAWILTYPYCAMGMLYTLPEHRRKGYAKALVSVIAKKLHSEGYPVYCFIEEENKLSYRLFSSLGFTEDPSYRTMWCSFNQEFLNQKNNSFKVCA